MDGGGALVVVTGLPGAGKSTLARPLARALDAHLLGQDTVTEVLFETLGVRDRTWTRELSRAALDVVLTLAASGPRTVVDAWWPAGRGERLRSWSGPLVEVRCVVDPAVAAQRFARRTRHAGHHDDAAAADAVAATGAYAGLGLPCTVLEVDTTATVDAAGLAARVRTHLPA